MLTTSQKKSLLRGSPPNSGRIWLLTWEPSALRASMGSLVTRRILSTKRSSAIQEMMITWLLGRERIHKPTPSEEAAHGKKAVKRSQPGDADYVARTPAGTDI
mmetsp:Transcript_650/g.1331  ORF Transcript_650/g.1331 Transcript_650/m.1331 type:complete len:103 (-) Transcript_650:204-512(-)